MQTFLVLGAIFGFIGVALGAFGSHALRSKLTSERVATFETGVRYQMWHALALFVVVIVETVRGARLIRIPETDHVISIRKPGEFNRTVLGFLAEVL